MAVTSYDGSFSFKQDSLARLGDRGRTTGMNAQQRDAFNNSPFMQGVRRTEERCWEITCDRDRKRAASDPAFKPQDSDFSAAKSHPYDKAIDYYQVLGIDEYASHDEVKKAYKKLSLIYHPDKSAGLTQEEKDDHAAIFIELKNAYQTLGDQATRRQYDRDRDRDKAAFELNGSKPKKKAHFNAQEVLKHLLENQKPPGKTLNVNCAVKLEKFFYGGHKAVVRDRRMKSMKMESTTYRIDVPRGASEPYECIFRGRGNHNENTLPDTLCFQVKSKPHERILRKGDDLHLKSKLLLTSPHSQPYLTLETPSVNGRHIMLWGRSPFYGGSSTGSAELHVRLRGEGLRDDNSLNFICASSLSGDVTATPSIQRSSKGDDQVLVTLRNLQTEAKLYLSVKKTATIGQLRQQVATVLELKNFSEMRILRKLSGGGGYTPYSDAQKVGDVREFAIAGITFNGVPFNQDRHVSFLQAVVKRIEQDDFQRHWQIINERAADHSQAAVDAQLLALWQDASWVMTEFGLNPTAETLQSQLKVATKEMGNVKGNFVKGLLEKLNRHSSITVQPTKAEGKQTTSEIHTNLTRSRRAGLKAFLNKHGLGPPGGFDIPGSDTEEEHQVGFENQIVSNASHGHGAYCDAKSIKRRIKRLSEQKLLCEVELSPISEAIHLFTKPSCSVRFYSNARQSAQPRQGYLKPRPIFACSLSSPTCAKGKAKAEWMMLKDNLLPVLRLTAFKLFQAARQILPRSLPDFPAFTCGERQEAVVPNEDLPMPWKRLADVAFKQGDNFTAMIHYSRCLVDSGDSEAGGSSIAGTIEVSEQESTKEFEAIILSNRAACFAKVGLYQESLQDAQSALKKKPNWGKAWSRAGLAASSLGKTFQKEAIDSYSHAVEFDPSPANLDALHGIVMHAMKASADAAHAEKEKGNRALLNRDFGLAVANYTVAIALIPKQETILKEGVQETKPDDHMLLRAVLYSNRCGTLCMLCSWDLAIADGRKAVAAKGDFAKARAKLGAALLGAGLTEQAYPEFARALYHEGANQAAASGRQACLGMLPLWKSMPARKRLRSRLTMDLTRPSTKVYAISDVFFDHKANEDWAHSIHDFKFAEDVLIVAGNMCDSRNALARALVTFKAKFRRVFYVPGNHEMGLAGDSSKYPDSFAKLLAIFDLCDELGVDITPAAVCKGVFIVPLLSWYSCEFDTRDPFPDVNDDKTDQHCRWPMDKDHQVWKFMLALNMAHMKYPYHGTVITFSHFLPRPSLTPSYVGRGERKSMGCEAIDDQARAVGSQLHVFGHTKKHFWGKEGKSDGQGSFFGNLLGYCNTPGHEVIYANHYHGREDEHMSSSPPLLCVWNGTNLRKQEVSVYQ